MLSATAAVLSVLAILGYAVHSTRLIAFGAAWQGMSLLTALAVLVLAAPLLSGRFRGPGTTSLLLCFLALLCLLAVLGSHALVGADVISPWIADALFGIPPAASGRVSVATALGLLALACTMFTSGGGRRHGATVIEIGANCAILIAAAAVLGYAYGISDLYRLYLFNTMSLPSALAIACLGLARLIAEPETRLGMALRSPNASVRGLRRTLVLTAIPALFGWLLLQAGGVLANGNSVTIALLVIVASFPMFYLLLENARNLELLERERRSKRDGELRLAEDLRIRIDEQAARLEEGHRTQVKSLAEAERSKRFELIAQLTGGVAHDFNNLLMVIGGNAQLLKLRQRGDPEVAPLVDKIAATVKSAAKLTAQLAAFSSIQRLEATPFHVDSVVRAAICETILDRRHGIELTSSFGAADNTVLGDSGQLQVALVHLIRNACEAMKEGGVLSVATTLQVTGPDRQSVCIVVEDNGRGMDEEELGRSMEPFFTTKRDGNHTGLGLAQVGSVIHQASGTMQMSSTVGRGTIVELCLPCVAAFSPGVTARAAQWAAPAVAGKPRLLVIDDDDEVRTVIVALLRQLRYEVVEASSGKDGLALLASTEPAVAIIDFLMPDMNGAEVALRARRKVPDLPVIFVSGYSDSNAIDAVAGSRVLRKPVEVEDLERAVADVLHRA